MSRWTKHDGGECPVGHDCTVEIETIGGSKSQWRAGDVIWRKGTWINEIMEPLPRACEVKRYRILPLAKASPQTDTVADVAGRLSEAQRRFVIRVCDGLPVGLADRAEDKVRQKMRRMGLVCVAKNPRRWVARALGYEIRTHLSASNDIKGDTK